jgi:riboflavin kinase/FMN adenylyltransferase
LRVLSGLEALPDPGRAAGCAATVGVFDGVHLGHFVVLRKVVERAHALGARPLMVTFTGHPKELLLGHAPPAVTSLEHRLLLFERAGIGTTLVLEFTPELRELTAEQFVRRILLEGLGLRELVFGFDSKFGRDRGGNPESLAPLARALGFAITEVPPLRLGGRAVSSTAVREAVTLGDLRSAALMLGRPVSVLGTVVRGDGRGRGLGFPTANLDLHHELHPPEGVYAALARWEQELRPAVVNIGRRPTFAGTQRQVEVHLLECEADLYGCDLEVFFLEKLREERAFPDRAALSAQIHADVARAAVIAAAAPQNWRVPGRYLPIEGASPAELGG